MSHGPARVDRNRRVGPGAGRVQMPVSHDAALAQVPAAHPEREMSDDDKEIIKYRSIVTETPRAYLFDIEGEEIWIGKSQAVLLSDNRVAIPLWIARQNNLTYE